MTGNLSKKKGLLSEITDEKLIAIAEMLYTWAGFGEMDITQKEDKANRLSKEQFLEACKTLTDEELDKLYASALIIAEHETRLGTVENKADAIMANSYTKEEVYTKDEIDNMKSIVRVTLSINEDIFDWYGEGTSADALASNSNPFIADITASEVYDLYKDGKDIILISEDARPGFDPVVNAGPNNTEFEVLFTTENIYRLDSVQEDIIMFTKPQTDNPLIIEYVKAYISTNTWTTGSYKADAYSKSEIDDKIGDIDSMLDKLHAYAQILISGGES